MTELEKKLTNALLMIRDHINEPEVITSIVDKNIDKNIGTDKDLMLESTPASQSSSSDEGCSNDKKHEGFEEQAEGLDNLLKGLKDTPHDDRW